MKISDICERNWHSIPPKSSSRSSGSSRKRSSRGRSSSSSSSSNAKQSGATTIDVKLVNNMGSGSRLDVRYLVTTRMNMWRCMPAFPVGGSRCQLNEGKKIHVNKGYGIRIEMSTSTVFIVAVLCFTRSALLVFLLACHPTFRLNSSSPQPYPQQRL